MKNRIVNLILKAGKCRIKEIVYRISRLRLRKLFALADHKYAVDLKFYRCNRINFKTPSA